MIVVDVVDVVIVEVDGDVDIVVNVADEHVVV